MFSSMFPKTLSMNSIFQDLFNDIYYVLLSETFSLTYTMLRFQMVLVSVDVFENITIKMYI